MRRDSARLALADIIRRTFNAAKAYNVERQIAKKLKAALQESRIIDLTVQLTDFAETAVLVSCLDLVIARGNLLVRTLSRGPERLQRK